ncbi:MAG: VTC domain-containing protein [Agathobacter sp.]
MADQMIFKRYEIKYLLNREQYQLIRRVMDDSMTEDQFGHSTIHSLYLDTPDLLLARRSLEKPLYKEKLRLRSYGDTTEDSTVFVEIKNFNYA